MEVVELDFVESEAELYSLHSKLELEPVVNAVCTSFLMPNSMTDTL